MLSPRPFQIHLAAYGTDDRLPPCRSEAPGTKARSRHEHAGSGAGARRSLRLTQRNGLVVIEKSGKTQAGPACPRNLLKHA